MAVLLSVIAAASLAGGLAVLLPQTWLLELPAYLLKVVAFVRATLLGTDSAVVLLDKIEEIQSGTGTGAKDAGNAIGDNGVEGMGAEAEDPDGGWGADVIDPSERQHQHAKHGKTGKGKGGRKRRHNTGARGGRDRLRSGSGVSQGVRSESNDQAAEGGITPDAWDAKDGEGGNVSSLSAVSAEIGGIASLGHPRRKRGESTSGTSASVAEAGLG